MLERGGLEQRCEPHGLVNLGLIGVAQGPSGSPLVLRRVGRLALADVTVETSARRFVKLGVVRTYARMWRVTLLYFLGTSPAKLRQIYEQE